MKRLKLLLVCILCAANVLGAPSSYAQVASLPAVGQMVGFTPSFVPMAIKGMVVYPQDPFKFDFIMDQGQDRLEGDALKDQAGKMAAYFLASLTTPEKEIWVNLSPYEKDRVIPGAFGSTTMGQELLAQDYLLKQIMATALYPERELGREFWQKVYAQAREKFGTDNVQVSTFNKVWIVPDKAVVYVNPAANAVFVAESSLKVMLEKDYTAMKAQYPQAEAAKTPSDDIAAGIIRTIVIPALTKEVNEGKNFARLRQVYQALILAKWYRQNLKESIIAKGYMDRNKVAGVAGDDKAMAEKIYAQYLKAYRKGVYNLIKEEVDPQTGNAVPRKYFSGGIMGTFDHGMVVTRDSDRAMSVLSRLTTPLLVAVALTVATPVVMAPEAMAQNVSVKQVEAVTNGGGDTEAAVRAFAVLPYSSDAVDAAAKILRLPAKPVAVGARDLLSSSAGPSILGVDILSPQGIFDFFANITGQFQNAQKQGDIAVRVAAANYIKRVAPSVSGGGLLSNTFGSDVWSSLMRIDREESYVVRLARLDAAYRLMQNGKYAEDVIGPNIKRLDTITPMLYSNDPLESAAAAALLAAVPRSSRDNNYKDMIEKAVKDIKNLKVLQILAPAMKENNIPAPALMTAISDLSRKRPDTMSDFIGAQEWYANMQSLGRQTIGMSGSREALLANMQTAASMITGSGATAVYNNMFGQMLFMAVQQGRLSKEDMANQLNPVRAKVGLPALNAAQLRISAPTGNVLAYVTALGNGDASAMNKLIAEGGPMFAPYIIEVVGQTTNAGMLATGFGNMGYLVNVGAIPRVAMDRILEKNVSNAASYSEDMLMAMADAALSIGSDLFPVIFQKAMATANPAVQAKAVFRFSNGTTPKVAREIATFVLNLPNDSLNSINTGHQESNEEIIRSAADAIYKTFYRRGAANPSVELEAFLNAQLRPSTPAAGLNARMLRELIQQKVGGQGDAPGASVMLAGKASTTLIGFLKGNAKYPVQDAVAGLRAANDLYKNARNEFSALSILRATMDDAAFKTPVHRKRMADVLMRLDTLGFNFLLELLGSGDPTVDEYVFGAIKDSNAPDKTAATAKLLDTVMYWLEHRDLSKAESLDAYDGVLAAALAAVPYIGTQAVSDQIDVRIKTANPLQHIVLTQLGEMVKRGNAPLLSQWKEYSALVSRITSPRATAADVHQALEMLKSPTIFIPAMAWDDLNALRDMPVFTGDLELMVRLQVTLNVVMRAIGDSVKLEEPFRQRSAKLATTFHDTKDTKMMTELLQSFVLMPPGSAGKLFLDAIKDMDGKYAKRGQDAKQWETYFRVMATMRDVIRQSPPTHKATIVAQIKKDIEVRRDTTERFDNPEMVFLLRSLDTNDDSLAVDFGFKHVPDTRLLHAPVPPMVYDYTGHREIDADLTRLAGILRANSGKMPKEEAARRDPMVWLGWAFNNRNPQGQIWAIQSMGSMLPAVASKLLALENDESVETWIYYLLAQYPSDMAVNPSPGLNKDGIKGMTTMKGISYGFLLGKTKHPEARAQVMDILVHEKELRDSKPAFSQEAARAAGKIGDIKMADTLLDILLTARSSRPGKTYYHAIGQVAEDALVDIAERVGPDNVMGTISARKAQISKQNKRADILNTDIWFLEDLEKRVKEVLKQREGARKKKAAARAEDRAMAAPSDIVNPGGIDLSDAELKIKGSIANAIPMATDRLEIVLAAPGLKPIVNDIRPLDTVAMQRLLGVNL